MSSQRYQAIPDSPPPSFRSRESSPSSAHHDRIYTENDPLTSDADRELADTFDSPSDDEDEEVDDTDERQGLTGGNGEASAGNDDGNQNTEATQSNPPRRIERRITQLPVFIPRTGRVYGGGNANDGVFSNLAAKPARGEAEDEKPPSYEAAAADATPPYWETTILAPSPYGASDEVYVDGLPVGSVFSFVWNAMISMSFQIVGFLLTYLLHTTHAAKNGSRAGLGITLVQYGFSMKGAGLPSSPSAPPAAAAVDAFGAAPADPNSHDFADPASDPSAAVAADPALVAGFAGISTTDWLAYALMIVGWFVLIRAVSDFLRARRTEQLVLQSPDRGLGVAVVAEDEAPATAV